MRVSSRQDVWEGHFEQRALPRQRHGDGKAQAWQGWASLGGRTVVPGGSM